VPKGCVGPSQNRPNRLEPRVFRASPSAAAGGAPKGSRSDDEDALDTWAPPPDVAAPERVEPVSLSG